MAGDNAKTEGFFAWASGVVAATAQAATKDGTLKAMGREAVKDIRSSFMEVFFGQKEGFGEPGAPLNPTQGEVADDRKQLPSPEDIGKGRRASDQRGAEPPAASQQPDTGRGR